MHIKIELCFVSPSSKHVGKHIHNKVLYVLSKVIFIVGQTHQNLHRVWQIILARHHIIALAMTTNKVQRH
jgi:hypothetical protein